MASCGRQRRPNRVLPIAGLPVPLNRGKHKARIRDYPERARHDVIIRTIKTT
jgi:hypothetical protein